MTLHSAFLTLHFEYFPISLNILQKHNFNGYFTFHDSFDITLLDLLVSLQGELTPQTHKL